MLVVRVPFRFTSSSMFEFIAAVISPDQHPRADRICLDFSGLCWIEPSGIAVLSNTVDWLNRRGAICEYTGANQSTEAIKFLDDSEFFKTYTGKCLRPNASVRSTTIPLRRVSHADSFFWLDQNLMPWLMRKLNMTRASLSQIDTCLKELFNNIKDHSGEDVGCIFVQHYHRKNEVMVALSDFGVGIPKTMERIARFSSDAEALLHASRYGVTSKSLNTNMGIGLDFLISTVVGSNRGSLNLYSYSGKLQCFPSGHTVVRRPVPVNGFYPGTFIELKLRTDTIELVEDEREDMEW